MYSNYKSYFDQYFGDKTKFKIEQHLEGAIQRDVIRFQPPLPRWIVEILYVVDNGRYEHLFDIRFKHAKSIGYAKWQNANSLGLGGQFSAFSISRLEDATRFLEERLF